MSSWIFVSFCRLLSHYYDLFSCSDWLRFGPGELLQIDSCVFNISWALPHLLGSQDVLDSCVFPHPVLESTISLRIPGFLYWRMAFRGQGLNDGCHHYCCCWVASVVSDSVRPRRRQPTSLPRPRGSPGKNTGVGCHCLFQCMEVKSESKVAQSCPTQYH